MSSPDLHLRFWSTFWSEAAIGCSEAQCKFEANFKNADLVCTFAN